MGDSGRIIELSTESGQGHSTELARSVKLSYASQVPSLESTPISTDLIYGLINMRTDGTRVLCGCMKESGHDFDVQVFRAGVEP